MTAAAYAELHEARALAAPRRRVNGTVALFTIVCAAQAAFGIWMSARGFRWGDAFYRSTSALFVLHSSDPKLADIGFVWMPLPTLLNLPWVALYPVWQNIVTQRRRVGAVKRRVWRRRGRCSARSPRAGSGCRAGSAGPSRCSCPPTQWCSCTRAPAWARASPPRS